MKYCKICNKEIHKDRTFCSNDCSAKYKSEKSKEIRICPICNKKYKISKKSKQICCNIECSKKYNKLPHIKKKRLDSVKQSNLKKYGYEYPFQNKNTQKKVLETFNEKFGGNSPMKESKRKWQQTTLKNTVSKQLY